MNAVVEILNAVGQEFFEFSLPMLIQSCVLILILLAVDAVLRRRVRAVFRYWIWLLVLVKLVLPPSLGSPVSVGTWFGDTLEVPMERVAGVPPARAEVLWPSVFEGGTPSTPAGKMPATQQPPVPESAISLPTPGTPAPVEHPVVPETGTIAHPSALTWHGLLLLIWAVVAFALMLLLAQRAYFVRGLLGQSEEANRTMLDELEDCRQRLGLRRTVALRLSPNATSPAVCGLLRPVILIPQSIAPRLQPQDLHAVLLHELAHVKRGDLWVNLIQTLLQIAYFYNPLLWLANAMIRRTREQAVDEAVLVAMGESASQYPETLVNIAKLAFTRRPALSLRLIGVVESKSALTARIKHILTRPLPKTAKLGLAGLTAVAIIGAILLPMAKARPLPRPELDVVSPTEEQDRTVVEVPVSSDGVVTLPNGVTVEFLGLHDCGSKEDTWWRPDGEVLPEAPYGYSTYIRSMQPNQLYEVLFRIISPAGRTFAKMEWIRGRSHAPGFLHRDGGRRSRGLPDDTGDLFTGTLNRGSEADQVRIDIGVGLDNAWEPLGVLDGQASEAVTLADAVIEPAREEGGKTLVTVSHRIMDREVRLVAVDRNGFVHEPAGYGTRQGRGIVGYEPRFELPLAEVRQFRLEAQKLTWMAFENVSLRPGQKTEVRSLLPNEGRESTGDAEPAAIAKLPNGAVVELVGIRDCAGGDESWWRPDGEALSVAPVDSSGGARGGTPKTMYEALIRIEAAAGKAFAETKWNDGSRFVPGLVRGIRYGGRPDSDIPREADRLFSIMLHPRRGATETRIDVGVGLDNAWELLGSLDGRASNATVTVPGAVIQPAREEEGKTVVTVSHQFADRAVRLVALDRHGFIRQPTKHRYGRGDDGGMCEATFGLPPAEIQEVRLEVQRLAWVTFQNVSLEAGKKTAVHVAVQSESSSDASVRAVVLPDVDREAKMLDLATGETLPLPQAGSPDEIWRAIGMLGRGDLVYDSNALILVRDAVSDQARVGPTPPFKTYDIKPPLPVALTVTTAEGARFEVTILAADERGCTLKYSRIPADRGAGGGAPVEPGKKDAALEFRIAPKADDLSSDVVEKQMQALLRGERSTGGDLAWFETRPSVNLSPDQITCESHGKIYLLLSEDASRRMPADGSWGLERVRETSDAVDRPAIDVALDERGVQRLGSFTKVNARRYMAVMFEGRVVAVSFIASPVSAGRLLITGRFADGEIGDLIASLRQNIRIAPGGESHNETVSSGGESGGASIYLPDLEKPGADTVLDLETRKFLSGEPMQRDPEYLDKLGKGDLAYEWANGKSGLLCFRGTRILEVSTQRPDGRQMTEAVQPDVLRREFEVYFIDAPRRYRVATARGEEYELNVISIDKGDSGGALVQIEKTTTGGKSGIGESESGPQTQVATPDRSLTTALPNGVTVTLLGLFTGRDMGRLEWWYPDGTPAPAERFVDFHRNYVFPPSPLFRYGYLIQFGVVPDMTVRTVAGVGAENRWFWHPSVPSFAFGLVMSDTPQFETELPSVGDIRVIVGTGAFKAVEKSYKYGPIQDVLTLDDGHRLVVSTPQAQYPRGLGINVIADTDNLDLRLRSTLANNEVDIDGAHLDQRCQTGPLISIDFRLTPDDDNSVTRISLDYRPADVAHFHNVSLHRGQKADVQIEVRPAQAGKAASRAELEKAAATLEFRIAPKSIDLDAGVVETLKQMRTHGGGLPESDFAWFPIRMDLTGQPYAITHESGGKAYVLLWNKPPHVILASQDWGLESVYRATYANLQQGIGLIFNDKGASLFHDLTAAHVQQNLAIVVEGTVVAMPNIATPLGRAAIITEQEIEVLLAVLERLTVGSQR
jgi:beta-lactamase regulating signal transducer with metallopeptidase domain